MKRRIFVNLLIIIVFAALAAYCYDIGKAYDLVLSNTKATVDGKEYAPMEAVQVYIDDASENPIFLAEDDQMVDTAVGRKHVLTIQTLDDHDKVVEEKKVPFTISQLGPKREIRVPLGWNTGSLEVKENK